MHAASAEYPKENIFNCACHVQITLNELVASINKEILPIYVDPRPGVIKHSFADIRKIKTSIGYEPIIDFKKGLRKTIDHYNII